MEEIEKSQQEKQSWLREIAEKSWEPELLVSGAAIYLTSNLPAWITNLDHYYRTDIVYDRASLIDLLPSIGFSFLTLISYMLLFAFVSHFVMRAFWVATVGLLSVFPQDIRYDHIPRHSEYFRSQLKKRLGTLQSYVNQLDSTCSSLLSISFLAALTLLGISTTYFIGYAFIKVISLLIPSETLSKYDSIIYGVFVGGFFLFGLVNAVLNMARFKGIERVEKFKFRFYFGFNSVLFPFTGDALQRISFVFLSNVPEKKYYMAFGVFMVMFMLAIPFTFSSGRLVETLLQKRLFYSNDAPEFLIDNSYYEDIFDPKSPILTATIPSEQIEGKLLKVFLSYPKRLDKELEKICKPLEVAENVEEEQASLQKDMHSIACLDKFFTIAVNDSIYQKDLLFHRHHVTKELGLLTYLPTTNFKIGKNILKITRYHSDSTQKFRNIFVIPFWYVPD